MIMMKMEEQVGECSSCSPLCASQNHMENLLEGEKDGRDDGVDANGDDDSRRAAMERRW